MKGRDLLELCRVSNLPTVWSNAILGYLLSLVTLRALTRQFDPSAEKLDPFDFLQSIRYDLGGWLIELLTLILPFSLLYVGGMIFNDYADREVDEIERPGRPIPSGRVKASTAAWLAAGCLLLGFLGVVWMGYSFRAMMDFPLMTTVFAALLVMAIVMYNATHQQNVQSVLLMGACRALIILSVASIYAEPTMRWPWLVFVGLPAVTLLAYTVLISLVARREVEDEAQQRRFAGPKAVMNMIAAMPLLDAAWLLLVGLWPFAILCAGCAGLTKVAHREIPGS